MAAPLAKVGIISIGEMGLGVAKLLTANGFAVLTNIEGRSSATRARAESAKISLVPTDAALVEGSDYIISIVPPRDAAATAERIISAHAALAQPPSPLYFLDLNAVSPGSANKIASAFAERAPAIRFVDGGIIGGPPRALKAADGSSDAPKWYLPSIVLSGPYVLAEAPKAGSTLASVLNTKNVGGEVGLASGLKCCYASLSKGFTALAIQSFSTAARLGVLEQLQAHLGEAKKNQITNSLQGMPPKAGRWVEEMHEIGKTFREAGGWGHADGTDPSVFDEIALVYRFIAEGSELGKEQSGNRVRGTTVDDVVKAIHEGLDGGAK
ncbi:6-phosphogluconate dehydrogenase C-terminal domain-like protein [Trichodelitschia bisporula]|uniref:6-phosphogluconate dehydrogenase C-terminal domain-like protein n=1 Tax=Trichodelitschia bisporula TaxID=703511 RepID=A0A6G1HUE8_9PEZI|nr:6-phosphogluconate dehydrogenase C-terminal domain-like protein [Trichodelitschia bisporula]